MVLLVMCSTPSITKLHTAGAQFPRNHELRAVFIDEHFTKFTWNLVTDLGEVEFQASRLLEILFDAYFADQTHTCRHIFYGFVNQHFSSLFLSYRIFLIFGGFDTVYIFFRNL